MGHKLMAGLVVVIALGYVAVGIGAAVFAYRRMRPGWGRRLVVAGILTLFFSLTLLVGHGIAPAPAWYVLGLCAVKSCVQHYGQYGSFYFGLLPMLVQWLILVLLLWLGHGIAERLRRVRRNQEPSGK